MKEETITEETINLASSTLTGDIRDFLLDRVKAHKKPWPAMSEDEQRDEILAAKEAAERVVEMAVRIVASEGRNVVEANLEQVTIKDGIKATLSFTNTGHNREQLGSATGQTVLVVTSSAEPFTGEKAPAMPTPNQAHLLDSAQAMKDDNITPLR